MKSPCPSGTIVRPDCRLVRYVLLACSIALIGIVPSANVSAQAAAQERRVEAFTLAFVDADARRVVDAVFGSMLEVDYTIDPAVQGNITLRTAAPVPSEELIGLLEASLRPIGAVIVRQGDRYAIIPREAARGSAPLSVGDPGTAPRLAGYASEVITIRAGSARQIAELIRQFVGEEAVAGVEPSLNRIIISGDAEERSAARQIIERFDVSALADMRYELVRLETVDPQTLTRELEHIFQPPYDIIGSRVRVIPLPRLKSVLLIAANQADIVSVQDWIVRLDTGAAGNRRLYSYAVQNGRARDIAQTLQQVLPRGVEPVTTEPFRPSTPVAVDPATEVADADVAINSYRPPVSAPATSAGPRVVPNDETNTLLIYADGEEYEFIRDALSRLDQPVPQVLIEAILAEVTLTDDFEYGLDFSFLAGDTTFTNSGTNSPSPTSLFPGLSIAYAVSDAAGVLNALQSKTDVRVLSAPKLIVLNNQTATLQVGDQVPIITSQVQGVTSPGAPIVNNVDLKDTGVILQVTPRVNESGAVTLDITQEVSDVAATTTSGINSPTIQQRKVSTSVTTRSGEMIALGGLIRNRLIETRSGIPLLSQIPIIGGLFGTQGRDGARTELIILLTPTVIRSPGEVRQTVDDLLDALDAVAPLVDRGIADQVGGRSNAGD